MHGIALVVGVLIAAGVTPAYAKAKQPPELSGEWRLDADKSQMPNPPEQSQAPPTGGTRRGGGGLGRGGGGGGGGWGGGGGGRIGGGRRGGGYGGGGDAGGQRSSGGARRDRSGSAARPMLLPPVLRIDEAQGMVRLADTTGTEVAEILLESSAPPVSSSPSSVRRLTGKWKGSHLQATSDGAEGAKIIEAFSLKSKGRTLEIKTKVESSGDRPSFEFTRVYEKVAG
jgi:hypothetical protein